MRERMYYKNNPTQYQRRIEQAKTVDADTADNLVKMAIHVVKGVDASRLMTGLKTVIDFQEDDFEAGRIEERVSRNKAAELHEEWRKILLTA